MAHPSEPFRGFALRESLVMPAARRPVLWGSALGMVCLSEFARFKK